MKKQFGKLFLAAYPALKLTILPLFNYSLMNQLRNGQKIYTSLNFYLILFWFIVSILIFTYIFKNLMQFNKVSILIGLIISTFFVICILIPLPFMSIVAEFYQIFIYNYLTTFYLSLSTLSIYTVLFFLSIRSVRDKGLNDR